MFLLFTFMLHALECEPLLSQDVVGRLHAPVRRAEVLARAEGKAGFFAFPSGEVGVNLDSYDDFRPVLWVTRGYATRHEAHAIFERLMRLNALGLDVNVPLGWTLKDVVFPFVEGPRLDVALALPDRAIATELARQLEVRFDAIEAWAKEKDVKIKRRDPWLRLQGRDVRAEIGPEHFVVDLERRRLVLTDLGEAD